MFNVYVTATLFTPDDGVDENPILTRENKEPLDAEAVMALARECSQRNLVGYIRVVEIEEDAVVFEWHHKLGVLFPEQLKGKW